MGLLPASNLGVPARMWMNAFHWLTKKLRKNEFVGNFAINA